MCFNYRTFMPLAYKTLIYIGNLLSTVLISFENLAKIRPPGVVSKNEFGKCKTLLKRYECRILQARIHPFASIKLAKQTDKAKNKKSTCVKSCILFPL